MTQNTLHRNLDQLRRILTCLCESEAVHNGPCRTNPLRKRPLRQLTEIETRIRRGEERRRLNWLAWRA